VVVLVAEAQEVAVLVDSPAVAADLVAAAHLEDGNNDIN
jgi:hypothetical protein